VDCLRSEPGAFYQVGAVRASSEKELILCNMLTRREATLELGRLRRTLYPNEENALMDELQKRGGKLIYDSGRRGATPPTPDAPGVLQNAHDLRPRRAEQFRLHPTPGSAMNFVPPLFVLYLVLLILLNFSSLFQRPWVSLFILPRPLFTGWYCLIQTIASVTGWDYCAASPRPRSCLPRMCFTGWASGADCSPAWIVPSRQRRKSWSKKWRCKLKAQLREQFLDLARAKIDQRERTPARPGNSVSRSSPRLR